MTARGVCWSTSPPRPSQGNHTSDGTGNGSFVSNITGLTAGTLYYVRAYATNSAGTAYGNELSFTTLALPTVTTAPVTNITQTGSTSGGNVISGGGADVTARGVCWSTTPTPVVTGNHTTNGSGTGSFVSNITGLTAGTTYYVRAYATNCEGTGYGDQLTFTTLPTNLATVTTNPVTNIKNTTATCGGNVTSGRRLRGNREGVCWNTSGKSDNQLFTYPQRIGDRHFYQLPHGIKEEYPLLRKGLRHQCERNCLRQPANFQNNRFMGEGRRNR
ncbi:MAG: hypothetical protein MZV63_55745 [Marinilabiliales bacterium]|nr:hypothetical protein [Marinilabiliales bacterium]